MSELTEVFSKRQQQFVQFAYSYVRNREEAEDIVMGAFTNVWEHRNELREDTNISALLLTAIKNRSLNHLQHLRISTLEACDPDKLFCDEIQALVQEAISELPPTSREVFILSRMKNLPNKEIALRLDISVKTVEFHITRSLKQLRVQLKDYQFLWSFL